jgi:hypothetical protein
LSKNNIISLENPDLLLGLLRVVARELIAFYTIHLRTKNIRTYTIRTIN